MRIRYTMSEDRGMRGILFFFIDIFKWAFYGLTTVEIYETEIKRVYWD